MADSLLTFQTLRSVPELKYVNAENVVRYRAIMRFFYQEYKRLRYWMKPEEVFAGSRYGEYCPGIRSINV